MAAPSFTPLNGHIRTPLRFYQAGQTPYWAGQCVDENEPCPFAIPSGRAALPPFQAWAPLTDSAVTVSSWVLRRLSGGLDVDMAAYLSELDIVKFEEVYYVVHYGSAFGGLLPNEPLYNVITMSDGVVLTSELFHPKCGATGETQVFPFSDSGWCDWAISVATRAALGFFAGPGSPGGSGNTNDVWINTQNNTIYTWAGAWLETPVVHGMVYFVRENCRWYQYDENTAQWEQMGPASPWYITTGGICFGGNNPDELSLLTGIPPGVSGLSIVSFTITNHLQGQLVVGVGSGSVVASGNGSFEFLLFVGAGSVFFAPDADFDGCITNLSFSEYRETCHYELRWSNCGNVGNTYYEEGFENRYPIERSQYPSRPTPTISLESTENGRKDVRDNFRRKETEWVMDIGLVPWHVADALSDIPLHTTVLLALVDEQGDETLTNVRVEVSYDTPDQRCLASVVIFFQAQDSVVNTRCCETFEPLCNTIFYSGTLNSPDNWFLNGGSVFGTAVITINLAGEPALPLASPGYVVNLADGLVYFWNGTIWSVVTPSDGDIWYVYDNFTFYEFQEGRPIIPDDDEWVAMEGDAPITWSAAGMCFTAGIGFQADLVDPIPAGTQVRIRIFIDDQSGNASGYVSLGGTFSSFSESGAHEYIVTTVNPSTVVQVELDDAFQGCVQSLELCEVIE